MTTINDGGPALPVESGRAAATGMTLRDYFAAKADVDDRLDRITNEEMTSIGLPDSGRNNDVLFWMQRHFKAKAILKYMEADAMLEARLK